MHLLHILINIYRLLLFTYFISVILTLQTASTVGANIALLVADVLGIAGIDIGHIGKLLLVSFELLVFSNI
jgi:hypothetical protein